MAEPEAGGATRAGRNIIVAIGINDYQHHAQLDNPINDAQAILAFSSSAGSRSCRPCLR